MSAPASEELRELERLLVIARETGEPREFASLREELSIGHDDLEAALEVLREHGKASEVTPGEWDGGDGLSPGEESEPERVTVHLPDLELEDGAERAAAFLRERDGERPGEAGASPAVTHEWVAGGVEPTVRLTMAIAGALDAQTLGALIKAGIDDAATREGEVFVLEVLP